MNDVLQPFKLPKPAIYVADDGPPPPSDPTTASPVSEEHEVFQTANSFLRVEDIDDTGSPVPEEVAKVPSSNIVPMSMQEMAEAAAKITSDEEDDFASQPVVSIPPPETSPEKIGKTPTKRSRGRRQTSAKQSSSKKRTRGNEENAVVSETRSVPSKRPRTVAPVPPSTRTLRPRKSKSQAQLQRELEEEALDEDSE